MEAGIKKSRWIKDRVFFVVVCFLSSLTAIPLVLILWEVLRKGYRQLNWSFFTEEAPNSLEAMLAVNSGDLIPGGVANGLVGSLLMVLMAIVIAVPVGIFTGIRWVVKPLGTYSGFAGGIALAVLMLPLIIRSTEETLKMLPGSLKEAGLALGASYSTVVLRVLLPSAFGGLFTGILLAVSRVLGETAPLMLTALGASAIEWNVFEPMSALPLQIWEFYNDPNLAGLIWSTSLFLLLLILALNLTAKRIARKWKL